MKFLCVECDAQMHFSDRHVPGDGTMAALFRCPECGRTVGMLTNPMETRLVSSLGVKVGGQEVPGEEDAPEPEPLAETRAAIEEGRNEAVAAETSAAGDANGAPDGRDGGPVVWSDAARRRLQGVPRFVRGMVHRIYTDYAKERGIAEITPEVMDRARSDLGLEGM